jgi:ankyrin repeat protein
MLAANNFPELFDYLFPVVSKKIGPEIETVVNKQNSTGNTPLRRWRFDLDYAVITNSKEMVQKLIEIKADTNIKNEAGRTPFAEAEEFDK